MFYRKYRTSKIGALYMLYLIELGTGRDELQKTVDTALMLYLFHVNEKRTPNLLKNEAEKDGHHILLDAP